MSKSVRIKTRPIDTSRDASDSLAETVQAALTWLQTVLPDRAVVPPRGITTKKPVAGLHVSINPAGYGHLPVLSIGRRAVFEVNDSGVTLKNAIGPDGHAFLVEVLDRVSAYEAVHQGRGWTTISFVLDLPAGASMWKGIARFSELAAKRRVKAILRGYRTLPVPEGWEIAA